MKKIIYGLVTFILVFLCSSYVKAIQFHYGDEVQGERLLFKKTDTLFSYFNLRYVYDEYDRLVFCIEPNSTVLSYGVYTEYQDISEYTKLTKEQIERIKLIIFYGYGNPERQNDKWFSITQFKIWETILPEGYVQYTNESRVIITKYQEEMNLLEQEIASYYEIPNFVHDYTVNYKDNLIINELTSEYDIVSNNVTMDSGYFILSSVTDDTTVSIRKKVTPRYNNNFVIYSSTNSQDLMAPGDISYPIYNFNINVQKGKALIDIKKIDDVYTVESDFSNTCYDISKDGLIYESFCTDKEITYETDYLPFGTYDVKQTSNGIGYREDTNIYHFTISENNKLATLSITNYLIRNTINIYKYYCKEDVCLEEENAVFKVYDKFDNVVDELVTDNHGYASILLGYGKYTIKQVSGLENYTLAPDFQEHVVDEVSDLSKKLFNYYIEVIVEEEPPEDEIAPPSTGINCSLNIIAILVLIVTRAALKFYNKVRTN